VDPGNPDVLSLAQYDYRQPSGTAVASGFWRSIDGGSSWSRTFSGLPRDLVRNTGDPGILYMTVVGNTAALYQSVNGGTTWSRIFTSPFDSGRTKDIRVAVTAADSQTLYVYFGGTTANTIDLRLAISHDGGASWDSHALPTVDNGQFGANTYIYAAPKDANTVYIGSRDVYKSTDGGQTWANITQSFTAAGPQFNFTPATAKVHADQRGFAFSPLSPSTIYLGCDGGLWQSTDAGSTFRSLNGNLSLTQFYSITVAPNDPSLVYAGSQDNGYQIRLNGSTVWKETTTGDAGPIVVNPTDPSTVFVVLDGAIQRWRGQGRTFDRTVATPSTFGETWNATGSRIAFIPPLAGNGVNSNLYFGTRRLYVSTDLGNTWSSPGEDVDLTKGVTSSGADVVTTIGIGPADSNIIYTGSAQGRVMVTNDAGVTWTDASNGLPDRFVKSIVVDPTNSSVAYLSVSGFASSHVFMTIDAGQDWMDINGDLPDIPTNALLIDPVDDSTLYAGTDVGMFRSVNGGLNWQPLSSGMPPVIVSAFAASPDGLIRAATYGRGVYELSAATPDASLRAGQVMSNMTAGQGALSVGYAQVSGSIPQPAAFANFGFTQNGVLVSEAGIPAASPVRNARLFVDFASTTNSGVALVNPGSAPISITTQLRAQNGTVISSGSLVLPGRSHTARFVDQMVTNIPKPFLGTLTLSSAASFVAVNLSAATNGRGETLFNALPVADLDQTAGGTSAIFPQVVDGGGITTQVLLMNPSATATSTGSIAVFGEDGGSIAMDFGPGVGTQSSFNYTLPPNGMMKLSTRGSGSTKVGYVMVTRTGGVLPVGSGIFAVSNASGLVAQAGVPSAPQTTAAQMFAEVASLPLNRNTGVAIVNRNAAATTVTLNLTTIDGSSFTASTTIPANGHVAKFVNELFSGLPTDFQGQLTVTSNVPVAPLTLRLTTNQRGDSILSTLPVVDLKNLSTGPLYLTQVVDGAGYRTQFIVMNTSGQAGTVHIDIFDENGNTVIR
jgi:photosystem II stability/assembly factor-like uncharacterized protein